MASPYGREQGGKSTVAGEFFPDAQRLVGREVELATLAGIIERTVPGRLALVGSGGSGKSMLAAALAQRMAGRFRGGVHWFRVGAWDFRTLTEMLALRFGTRRRGHGSLVPGLRRDLARRGDALLVLDNHEDDRAMAHLLDSLSGTPATFVITARRCLLAGVLVFPVTAPLVTSGESAFPRVAELTRRLRWNPLALDVADAIVRTGAAKLSELGAFLDAGGVSRVRAVAHEDDLPEVALLVDWAWRRLPAASQRMLGVLSHSDGDSIDADSLAKLADARKPAAALAALSAWHLVQEPMRARFAVHAVIRHAIRRKTRGAPARLFEHYVALLEAHPERLMLEQTNLFAAMDHSYKSGDMSGILRIERLLRRLSDQ
jgi:hypothetical protein